MSHSNRFFHRSNLPSHIKGLSLSAKSILPSKLVKKLKTDVEIVEEIKQDPETSTRPSSDEFEPFAIHPSWEGVDHRSVVVNCFWDNPKFHDQFSVSLYMEWIRMKERENNSDKDKADDEDKDDQTLAHTEIQNQLSK